DSLKCDLNFIRRMYEEEFEDNEALMAILEDMSSWWVDDVEYVVNVINRGVEGYISSSAISHPDLFIKDDDREYALRLLEASLINFDEYFQLVTDNLANWDSDRLVATDAALIVMGLAEAVTFSSIPVKVSINEYVELAKHFGTPNSRQFVNGLLDKLIQTKLASGEIVKSGRGLYEGEPAS
ncbi:MAG: transcription antitermination protein NusB, partial [Bacteroidales bacterium]|nr:transcription antitermination protein NusB [Bacteroidales bacterium]